MFPRNTKYETLNTNCGFTLVEMLVVVAIVTTIITASIVGAMNVSRRAQIANAVDEVKKLRNGVLQYHADIGFFPPNTARGADPGLVNPIPPDSDLDNNLSYLPSNWKDIVQERWNGPYIDSFPQETTWKGLYDYQYFNSDSARDTCTIQAGIYWGISNAVSGGYGGPTAVPSDAEQYFIDIGMDNDGPDYAGCENREVNVLIHPLN